MCTNIRAKYGQTLDCRSVDGGVTWSSVIRVIGDPAQSNSTQTYRNPYPTVLLGGGHNGGDRIILNVANSTDDTQWVSLQMFSDDEGDTWSHPTPLANFVGSMAGVLGGPGNGIELRNWNATQASKQTNSPLHNRPSNRAGACSHMQHHAGRLLSCGATGYHHGHHMYAAVWYSDDCGDTWTIANTTRALDEMQECQVAELVNGRLVSTPRSRIVFGVTASCGSMLTLQSEFSRNFEPLINL